MTHYQTNADFPAIAAELRTAGSFLITTHAKPDGDAVGCVSALSRALQKLGKRVERWFMPPMPKSMDGLLAGMPYVLHQSNDKHLPELEPDRVLIVDTGAWSQLEGMRPWLAERRAKTILIDHHLHGDDVAALRHVDGSAAACCELIAELIDALGVPIDLPMAEALYMGIATDTGWFRFSNTRPQTLRLAARLIEAGVDHARLFIESENSERVEKLLLFQRALASLKLLGQASAAIMTLLESDFHETGALPTETDRLVDLPQMCESVKVVVLACESGKSLTRLSFRSKPGPGAIDVNQLAGRFGGGGHARAAGAKVHEPLPEVLKKLEQIFEGK